MKKTTVGLIVGLAVAYMCRNEIQHVTMGEIAGNSLLAAAAGVAGVFCLFLAAVAYCYLSDRRAK